MEIDQLKAFLSLIQTKNFSKTAENLYIVQSAVSTRIRLLEEKVGKPLFTRTNRQVSVTPAGKMLHEYAKKILDLYQEAVTQIQRMDLFEDAITVGSTDSLWEHFFLPVLIDFSKKFPKTSLTIRTAHSWELIEQLVDGIIHFAFVYSKPTIPGITSILLYEDEVILVGSPIHPITKQKIISHQDLSSTSFLTCAWDGPFQDWMQKILPPNYFPSVYPDQLRILVHFLELGKGISFLPKSIVQEKINSHSLIELKVHKRLKPPKRKIFAIFKNEKNQRPSIERWFTLLKEHGFKKLK